VPSLPPKCLHREADTSKAYPPPGRLIDVGGHRLHLYCTGSGSPTVVLEPGGGASSSDFAWIAPAVAGDTRVCVYDRAGRGWSDATNDPQDGAHIAADLHTLLERAQVPGPYVLAGHSFGGLYVQSFAAQFPDQVAGMVLLDSTAPRPGPAQPTNTDSYNIISRVAALSAASAHLGAARLLNPISYTTLPPRSRDEARANSSTARHVASFVEEYGVANTSMQQASALTSLNGKPLIVLTADEGADDQWQSEQDHMTTLSTNSLHRHANATHASLLDDEADAAVASKAIHDVVVAVRTSRPLASR
jgi:pimeloyl-ACP methyl ester carboxylesterase